MTERERLTQILLRMPVGIGIVDAVEYMFSCGVSVELPRQGDTVYNIGVDLGRNNPEMNLSETILEHTYGDPCLSPIYLTREEAEYALKGRKQ